MRTSPSLLSHSVVTVLVEDGEPSVCLAIHPSSPSGWGVLQSKGVLADPSGAIYFFRFVHQLGQECEI